jgi:hypothetical protein
MRITIYDRLGFTEIPSKVTGVVFLGRETTPV